jgi:antitoxin component YwqK of YwqJK toxin-antitoxin module
LKKAKKNAEFKIPDEIEFIGTVKLHGTNASVVYDNGNIYQISHYINHKKNGENKQYYLNGTLKSISYYTNDKLIGECIEYHDNGEIR